MDDLYEGCDSDDFVDTANLTGDSSGDSTDGFDDDPMHDDCDRHFSPMRFERMADGDQDEIVRLAKYMEA